MFQKLKEQRGEFLLDRAFGMLIGAILLVLAISVFSVAFQSNKLTTMASDLARYIEVQGQVNETQVNTELQRLSIAANLENVNVTIDASYIGSSNRLQFGSSFTVTLSYTSKIGVGGIVSLPVPLHSSVVGRSERYWK